MKEMKELFGKGCAYFFALFASLWLGMLFWIVDISAAFPKQFFHFFHRSPFSVFTKVISCGR